MNYPLSVLKLFTILLPPLLIGSAEYVRHEWLLGYVSMEAGNVYITLIAFVLSFLYAQWMFRKIGETNARLAEEQARRAVYEERDRLAGELHDNIAQTLFFLNVALQKGRIEEARSAASEINSHLRQAIFNLRAMPEESAAFPERLRRWLSEWSLVSGIACDVRVELPERYFSMAEEVELFGLIQEAFTNIRKHSGATRADISLAAGRDGWTLAIGDNGRGLAGETKAAGDGTAEPRSGRYGMAMMKKRAEALGGLLDIRSPETGGMRIVVTGAAPERRRTE